MTYKVPFSLHGKEHYDGHFIVQGLNRFKYKEDSKLQIKAILRNSEILIMFRVGSFIFKDSMAFLKSSLEKLAESLFDKDFGFSLTNPSIPEEMKTETALKHLRAK